MLASKTDFGRRPASASDGFSSVYEETPSETDDVAGGGLKIVYPD
jgi:hypothetical protein